MFHVVCHVKYFCRNMSVIISWIHCYGFLMHTNVTWSLLEKVSKYLPLIL